MNDKTRLLARALVLGPRDGEIAGDPALRTDRFMINTEDTDGGFALVEHAMAPRVLAAPLHVHTREDEYSFVLEGRLGALLGDEEVYGEPGDLIFKPRGQWHTFWNAGDGPTRILELIAPAGLEKLFRELGAFNGYPEPEVLAGMAARFGCSLDFEGTVAVAERHGLVF